MAITATIDKFGMTFTDAYHKITRLNYESSDVKSYNYVPATPTVDEDGNPVPPVATAPEEVWSKVQRCNFEVATYASTSTREAHAEPIYRSTLQLHSLQLMQKLLISLFRHMSTSKLKTGYEDAVDC
jgi:hypothetical protein